jgi:PKD repeat protein
MVGARWWEFYNNTNVVPSGGGNQSTYMVVRAGSGVIWNNRVIGGKNDGGGGIELVEEDGGYPALYQIGRGQNQSSFPAYVWGNDSPADDPYSGSSNVQLSRDYYQSSPSYSYTPYTYPHPLITASGSGPVNQPPIPKASANSTNGVAPLSVSFSSSGSLDPEGATLSYSWVFGDGGGSNTANPSHTYQSSGVYSATLTVSDGTNTAVSPAIRISVLAPGTNRPPVAAASANVTNGQAPLVVSFSSSGSVDPEGATLTYSWAFGDGGTSTAANPSHTYQAAGTYSARLSVSDGTNSTSSAPLSITVTAVPNDNTTFTADSGSISPPFAVSSGAISQSVETGVSDGGRAVYAFTVGAQGDYQISTVVNAPTTGGNSFFVNIDSDPTDPTMIWDIPVTSGFEARTVSWRGNGVGENDQFVPKSFTLNAGAHQLIVIGREPDVQLQSITIIGKPAPPTGLRVVGP